MDVYLEKKRSVIRFAKNIRIRSIDIKKEQLNKMLAERSGNLSIFKVFDGMSEKLCELENIPYRSNRKKVMELLVSAVNIDLDEEVFYREMLVTLGISGNDKEMENDTQEKNKIIKQIKSEMNKIIRLRKKARNKII